MKKLEREWKDFGENERIEENGSNEEKGRIEDNGRLEEIGRIDENRRIEEYMDGRIEEKGRKRKD